MNTILFISLDTFCRTGGIQQYNRNLQHALTTLAATDDIRVVHWSLMDQTGDLMPAYVHAGAGTRFTFRGFGGSKWRLIGALPGQARSCRLIILGHVHLAPLALLPGMPPVWMIAHGVEVWRPLGRWQQKGLHRMQYVLGVSRYTLEQLRERQGVPAAKLRLLHNCLDPAFVQLPLLPAARWNRHWRLDTGRTYLLTVARLAHTEAAKGYDAVIEALPALAEAIPDIAYVLAGKWDEAEYRRIRELAERLGVADRVLMPGYVAAESLPALYHLAGCFVLPSTKEGFGIVYLEAAWWGCPVVACRAGGVPDALLDGALGELVPPDNPAMLQQALLQTLMRGKKDATQRTQQRHLITQHFGFEVWVHQWRLWLNKPA